MLRRQRNRLSHASVPLLIMLTLLLPLLAAAPPTTKAAVQPQITVTPSSGWYDTQIQIFGTNFPPNSEVRISWSTLKFWQIYTTTDSKGAFIVLPNVPDGLNAGNYVLTATGVNGTTASANFALSTVFLDSSTLGIRTPMEYVKWCYTGNSFYCDTWQMYHYSQNGWYDIMAQNYGIYVVRLTYNGITYIYDLAGGHYNQWPKPLKERVSDFAVTAPDRIQGKISISDPTGAVLLLTINVDIRAGNVSDDCYSATLTTTAETKLDNVAIYVAYNLNVNQPPNSALYDVGTDTVCQYYGPSNYGYNIPDQYKAIAGFGPVGIASTHHEVDIDYSRVLCVATKLADYDFDYTDKNEVHGDAFGDCAIGFQCAVGSMNYKSKITIPVVFASSSTTVDSFLNNIAEGKSKLQSDASILPPPSLGLMQTEGPGTTIVAAVGIGFMPHSQVNLDFAGITVGSYTTNALGVFNGNFVVPTSIKGTYTITATDNYGLKATTTFKVVELTWQWLSDRLDSLNATITGLITDGNGNLGALVKTDSGSVVATINEINATLAGLIGGSKDVTLAKIDTVLGTITAKVNDINAKIVEIIGTAKGDILARIDSNVGQALVKVDQINATLSGIIGNAKGDILARIDTTVGTTLVKVDQINATLTGIIGNAKGDILARIDSNIGQALIKVDQINATLTGIIGNAKGDILARIDTTVGQINATVEQINATLVGLVGNATGDILARIDSKVGETLVKADQINATLVGIIGNAKGDVLARIDSKVGETLVKVDQINATLVEIIGNAKGDVLARIDSRVGETLVKVDQINATLTGIIGNAKGDILARIDTNVGSALVKLDTLNGALSGVSGNMATIQTSIGKMQVSLDDINAKVTKIDNTTAIVQTSLGTLIGKVVAIEGDIVTIKTDIGTLKTDTKLVRSDFSLQPVVIAAVIEVAAISGIVYTIWAYRKHELAKKELVVVQPTKIRRKRASS